MTSRSAFSGMSGQRRSGWPLARPASRRMAPRSKSQDSFAWLATATRDIGQPAPFCSIPPRATITKARQDGQLPNNQLILLPFYQPRGIEPVEAGEPRIGVGKLIGERAQIAVLGEELVPAEDFGRRDRRAAHAGIAGEKVADDGFILLRFKGTGAVDQRAAWLQERDGAVDQSALQGCELDDVGCAFEPWHVGMAADGSGRGARRIEQDRVEWFRRPGCGVGADELGVKR